ncbi:MAG: hypothetical protein GX574_01080 [Lentisphaerae bacterium]|nr:hypothetical protein [Lentisphaerota bacterium]
MQEKLRLGNGKPLLAPRLAGMGKRAVVLGLGLVLSAGALMAADEDLLRKIEALQQQIQTQQTMLNQLRQQMLEQQQKTATVVKEEVKTQVDERLSKQSDQPLLNLGKGIDGLSLTGDLRVRYEYADTDFSDDPDVNYKSRFRHRVRLGGVWKNKSEEWEVGLGLEAGSSDGTSANQSWNTSKVWESGSVYLDYAYAKHSFGNSGLSLTIGQHKNPWKNSFLTFDGDLRPTGATMAFSQDLLFATIGAYNIRSDSKLSGNDSQSLANMYGGQAGLKFDNDSLKGLLAAGFYYYDVRTSEFQLHRDADDYNYQIGTLYGELGGDVGEVQLKGLAEVAFNFGADNDFSQGFAYGRAPDNYRPESNDLAWLLGFEAKFSKFKAKYTYAHIEGDSVPWFTSDSDFGSAALRASRSTNVRGHSIGLEYSFSKYFSIGATAMFTELIKAASDGERDGSLYQIDLVYKF